jgi:hypothetical protein
MRFVLLLFLPLFSIASAPDSTAGKYHISASILSGFIIAHRPALVPLQEKHVKGFDISVSKKRNGEKQWEQDWLFPETGLTLSCFDLGTEKLGKGVALYPYLDFPLRPDGNLYFRYGMGVGYVENVFDKDLNYKNAAVGSHWNGIIHFDLHYNAPVGKKSSLLLEAGITHYSNGSLKLPNLGINIAHANLGFKTSFGTVRLQRVMLAERESARPFTAILLSGGRKKVYPPYGKTYSIISLSSQRLWPLKGKTFAGVGGDLFYDNSISGRLRDLKKETTTGADDYRAGIFGALNVRVGSLGLIFNMGFYLYNPWKDDGNMYHRIGLQYSVGKIFLSANLKTHYARADFFEAGTGFRF